MSPRRVDIKAILADPDLRKEMIDGVVEFFRVNRGIIT